MDARKRLEALAGTPAGGRSLAEAALWIAAEEYPGLDVLAWLARLDGLGLAAAERVTPALDADGTAVALNRLLFEEQGFRCNRDDYYDPRNSFLNDVLERRLGIPITLSVVYIAVAAGAGVTVRGVGLPGHFLVQLEHHGETRLLDPFNDGRCLDEADCRELVRQVHGESARLDARHLRPVTTREILIRMLTNLKGVYVALGDWRCALAAVDRLLLLAPEAAGELRDRGGLYVKLGRAHEAVRDWDAYLRRAPDAPDAEPVRRQLRALRQALAALN